MKYELIQIINLARDLEEILSPIAHVCIGGSCLHEGRSDKDMDIYIYPHNQKGDIKITDIMDSVKLKIKRFGFVEKEMPEKSDDSALSAWICERNSQRVDFFFMDRYYNFK